MSDFIRPQPQRQRTQLQNIQRAIAAGAIDPAVVVPPPSGGGGTNALNVLGVGDGTGGQTTDFLEVESGTDVIKAGDGT